MKNIVLLAGFFVGIAGSNASAMVGRRALPRMVPICMCTLHVPAPESYAMSRASLTYPFEEIYTKALDASIKETCNLSVDWLVYAKVQDIVRSSISSLEAILNNPALTLNTSDLVSIILKLESDQFMFFSRGVVTPRACCANEFYTMIINNERVLKFFEETMPIDAQSADGQKKVTLIDSPFFGLLVSRYHR